jgi:hypothetical protein
MSNESVCHVARSWVDVGSFHTLLFGVVYVTCADFHDGSGKGTASVHQISCQSWEKCYGDNHNDSTNLRGPNLESYAGVLMVCPVQDRSHISWLWRTHWENHKLHNSWNCCTDSRARPSGSTSDHSRHWWWGGNWLWDIPTGSDERIGHAPCRSQVCVHDPDSFHPPSAVSDEIQNGCHPPPTALSWFGTLWLLPKGRRFDTIEDIQAETLRVLGTLTDNDFQEEFQKWRRRWDRCLHAGGNYFEDDGSLSALWWVLWFLERQSSIFLIPPPY